MQLPQLSSPRMAARLWSGLMRELAGGGHMLIEYPFGQRRRAYLLYLLKWFVPVRLYALLHDLDSLRFEEGLFDRLWQEARRAVHVRLSHCAWSPLP